MTGNVNKKKVMASFKYIVQYKNDVHHLIYLPINKLISGLPTLKFHHKIIVEFRRNFLQG